MKRRDHEQGCGTRSTALSSGNSLRAPQARPAFNSPHEGQSPDTLERVTRSFLCVCTSRVGDIPPLSSRSPPHRVSWGRSLRIMRRDTIRGFWVLKPRVSCGSMAHTLKSYSYLSFLCLVRTGYTNLLNGLRILSSPVLSPLFLISWRCVEGLFSLPQYLQSESHSFTSKYLRRSTMHREPDPLEASD